MAIPVIVCGRRESVGSVVIEGLKPEYEGTLKPHQTSLIKTKYELQSHKKTVIHFVMSPEGGLRNLPLILSGSTPANEESSLGSKIYSQPPRAIILGGGYSDDDLAKLQDAATSSSGAVRVPWLKADLEKTKRGPEPGTPEYSQLVALRVKETLGDLLKQKDLNLTENDVFLW